MASLASINIAFKANLSQFSSEMQNANRQLARTGKQFKEVGKNLSVAVTLPMLAFGAASVKTYGDMEALQKGLTAVMGSSSDAAIEFEKLKEVAKLPGLGLQEAVKGSVNLQAAGFSADSARKSLLSFGNALATVGKGAPELDLVVLALTQLNNKASGFGQDLRQLTEQLPQLRGALKAAFGTDDTAAISKLGITGRQVVERLTTEFEKLPKVTGGINNAFENTSDAIKISFGKIGQALNKSLNIEGLLNSLSETVVNLADSFSELSPAAQTTIIAIAGTAAAIGPLLLGIGAVLTIMPKVTLAIAAVRAAFTTLTVTMAANPFGAVAVALGLIVGAVFIANSRFRSLTDSQKEYNKTMEGSAGLIAKEKTELEKNWAAAKNEKLSKEQRLVAIQNLNALVPQYNNGLTLETLNTKKADEATKEYNRTLIQKAKVMAAQEKLVDVQKRLLDLQLGQLDAVQPSVWQNLGNSILSAGNSAVFAAVSAQTLNKNLFTEGTELEKLQKLLQGYIIENDSTTSSVKNLSGALETLNTGPLFGTIEYYKGLIDAQQKIQNSLAVSNETFAIAEGRIQEYQKAIDRISGKREPLEAVALSGMDSKGIAGSVDDLESQVSRLQALQSKFSTTSTQFQFYAAEINAVEFRIKAITDTESFAEAKAAIEGMREAYVETGDQLGLVAQAVKDATVSAFEGLSSRMVESLGLAATGMQGFMKIMLETATKLISALLSECIALAIKSASISAAFSGPGAVFVQPAFIATAVTGVISAFAAIPKFETGGIVGGNSFYGDKILARLNSGELILNQPQQKNLLSMIEPAGTNVSIMLDGAFKINGNDLELILDRVAKRNNRIR